MYSVNVYIDTVKLSLNLPLTHPVYVRAKNVEAYHVLQHKYTTNENVLFEVCD